MKYPFLRNVIDMERFSIDNIIDIFSRIDAFDFEDEKSGGRGRDYFLAQNDYPLNRQLGFEAIFNQITEKGAEESKVVLDILGGNGTLYRAAKLLGYNNLQIIINDISEEMIDNAYQQNIPCMRQPAQQLFLKDNSVDAVIFAYGTHHIPVDQRVSTFAETFRVLKDGGKIVIHDYEEGSITSKWYSEALDIYTYTGHDHLHFELDQLEKDLRGVGFAEAEAFRFYDPFIMEGKSPVDAKLVLLEHLISLFGMRKFREQYDYSETVFFEQAEKLIRKYSTFPTNKDFKVRPGLKFRELSVYPSGNVYKAEMPRIAMLAVGTAVK